MNDNDTIKLLIKLTPLEPYFFGTDRTFPFEQSEQGGRRAGRYFVRSAQTPSQTTLFGVLRYLGIWDPKTNYQLDKEDKNRIGENSFTLMPESEQKSNENEAKSSFGMIRGISPLYLINRDYDGDATKAALSLYCKAPLDHSLEDSPFSVDSKAEYSHFNYGSSKTIKTDSGQRCFPAGYEAKSGLVDGWLNIMSGTIENTSKIFDSVVRVGNNKQEHLKDKNDSFFKKEYFAMQHHSFAFFATVEKGFIDWKKPENVDKLKTADKPQRVLLGSNLVFLGHGRSAFKVEAFTDVQYQGEDPEQYIEKRLWDELLSPEIIYVQSPLLIRSIDSEGVCKSTSELYKKCCFVVTQTTTHRSFETKGNGRPNFEIGKQLIRLISPGSIFMPKDIEAFKKIITNKNNHNKLAGFSRLVGKPLI